MDYVDSVVFDMSTEGIENTESFIASKGHISKCNALIKKTLW
jgi:hypothetical protein